MFAEERSSRRRLFDRIAREGRQFMMDEDYDYFEADDEKEIRRLKEENKQKGYAPQAQPCDEPNTGGVNEPTTLWGKIKNYLKG